MEKYLLAILAFAVAIVLIGRALDRPWLVLVGESICGLFMVVGAVAFVVVWAFSGYERVRRRDKKPKSDDREGP